MEQYVIGMDGGGTKTAVVLYSVSGKILHRFLAGPVNYNGVSAETVSETFTDIFGQIKNSFLLNDCRCLCLGAAGVSNPEVKLQLEQQIRKCGYEGSLMIVGDQQTALYGALGQPCGIILIAGTGSICYGRNSAGKEHRTGGYGYLIDDEGSGYAIGRDILSAAVRAHDGRSTSTVLTQLLKAQAGLLNVNDLVKFVYAPETGKRGIASLAKILPDACRENDPAALKIVQKCAAELLALVQPVVNHLGLSNADLALCGSILTKDPYVRGAFLEHLHAAFPDIKCVEPIQDAAVGAAQMALAHYTGNL